MSDYLWDKQGEPEPDIEQLEQLLAPLAHQPMAFLPPARSRSRRPWIFGVSAAAAIAIALFFMRPKPPEQAGLLMSVHGQGAKLASYEVAGEAKLPVGAWLDTGASKVTLTVGSIGTVEIAAGSRLRIVETDAQRQVLELDHGELVAQITAPPRSFTVNTRHATAIDLGCAFTLHTDPAGEGRLIVTQGRVALADQHGGEVVVAAGSECGISDRGPGVPFSSDVSASFREAMLRYPHEHAALAKIVAEARAQDRDALDRMSALVDAKDRAVLERRLVELSRGEAMKPLEKPPTPQLAPHGGKLAPSREHKHAVKKAAHAVPASSRVAPAAPQAAPSTSSSKKAPVVPPSNEKLKHDPFRSAE
jgi:ferric-dicitrate binding protein FerR (iron transport regulator)